LDLRHLHPRDIVPVPALLVRLTDKLAQKQWLQELSLPTAAFVAHDGEQEIGAEPFGFPVVQKAARGGYDGRGVAVLKDTSDNESRLRTPGYLEQFIDRKMEVSVMVAANREGEVCAYQPVEMVFHEGGNVLDYLVGRVPGLDISTEDIRIRGTASLGTGSTPLFLIDGIPLISNTPFQLPEAARISTEDNLSKERDQSIISAVKSIPINDIDKIEILKSAQNLAAFGANGANGVIAIYTRLGNNETQQNLAKGIIEQQIRGYSPQRLFYSPKYTPETKKTNISDYRTTLFWKPDVTLRNGKTELTFYTSELSGVYRIFVEGISDSGRICLGEGQFEVW